MITIQRTDYAFAELNASAQEWEGIKSLVQEAVNNYDNTELDILIHGPAEDRQSKLETMAGKLMVSDPPPVLLHSDDLQMLLLITTEADNRDVPGLDPELKHSITDQLNQYPVSTIFADDPTLRADLTM